MRNEATYRVRDFDPELVLRPRCLCPADQDAYYTLLIEMVQAAGRCDIVEARRCHNAAAELALVPYELRELANRLREHARQVRLSVQHE